VRVEEAEWLAGRQCLPRDGLRRRLRFASRYGRKKGLISHLDSRVRGPVIYFESVRLTPHASDPGGIYGRRDHHGCIVSTPNVVSVHLMRVEYIETSAYHVTLVFADATSTIDIITTAVAKRWSMELGKGFISCTLM